MIDLENYTEVPLKNVTWLISETPGTRSYSTGTSYITPDGRVGFLRQGGFIEAKSIVIEPALQDVYYLYLNMAIQKIVRNSLGTLSVEGIGNKQVRMPNLETQKFIFQFAKHVQNKQQLSDEEKKHYKYFKEYIS